MNASKETRKSRPPTVKLGFLWVAVGVGVGMVTGLGMELFKARPNPLEMQLGGLVGFVAGLLVEAIRLWWRKRRRR